MNTDWKATCKLPRANRWVTILILAWVLTPLGWNLSEVQAFYGNSKCCGTKKTDCTGCIAAGTGYIKLVDNFYYKCGSTTDTTLNCTDTPFWKCYETTVPVRLYSDNKCTTLSTVFWTGSIPKDACTVPPNSACPPPPSGNPPGGGD